MWCASSTTTNPTRPEAASSSVWNMRYSGVVSTISRLPSANPAYTAARSSGVDSPVMTALTMPKRSRLARRWNTWSAMSARKG